MYTTTIKCDASEALYDSIKPEEAATQRFSVSVSVGREGKQVIITINAKDPTALKAATISILRLIEAAEKVKNGRIEEL